MIIAIQNEGFRNFLLSLDISDYQIEDDSPDKNVK